MILHFVVTFLSFTFSAKGIWTCFLLQKCYSRSIHEISTTHFHVSFMTSVFVFSRNNVRTGGAAYRRLLEDPGADLHVIKHKSSAVHAPLTSPSFSLSPSPTSVSPSSSPSPSSAPSTVPSPDSNSVPPNASRPSLSVPIPSPAESRSIPAASSKASSRYNVFCSHRGSCASFCFGNRHIL